MKSASIVVLAGGFGTRMKSQIPKVLHKICGKEMIYCILDEICELSDDIHIVLFNQSELIKSKINEQYKDNRFTFHLQDHEHFPGTAGTIMKGSRFQDSMNLIELKHDKIVILSGDMPLINKEKIKEFLAKDADIALGVVDLEDASGYGRVIIENEKIVKIIEEKDATSEIKRIKTANAGIYCFKKEVLNRFLPTLTKSNAQAEFYLTDIVFKAFEEDLTIAPIFGEIDDFIGVNSKIDLNIAENLALKKLRENLMKNGAILHLPKTIFIEFGVEIKGECEIENGVVLKSGTLIENSHIKAHSVIEGAKIINSQIGPFARIRPKSVIVDSAIGNFVEVKASNLNGIKAGHLSYLGDSEIESGTNVGAGVITCNYDGKTKHKTKIGKNVFIGSDTQLVAPLNIESNVLIAAGSTITRNINDGELAISRAKQENKRKLFYKFFKGENDE